MRTKILVVVVVGLAALMIAAALWLSSDAPSAPSAPRLVETFRVPACRAGTTGAEGCAERRVLALDATINQLRGEIVAAAPYAARDFIAGERQWYAAREWRCRGRATGAVETLARSACLIDADQLHVSVLIERLDDATS